ncbi:MAG: hypothetical protein MUC65_02525 [Pontiellaceae bacterium]|jgi:hypothetical protein|nr:hypothetical protein [Pontiellaceae bacterium]
MKKALILLTALVLAGCATKSEPFKYPISPKMASAYSGGEMIITWKSETNLTYTVYYTDVPQKKHPGRTAPPAGTEQPGTVEKIWKPLPQATALRGTGEQITVRDKIESENRRRYLLLTGDEKPY